MEKALRGAKQGFGSSLCLWAMRKLLNNNTGGRESGQRRLIQKYLRKEPRLKPVTNHDRGLGKRRRGEAAEVVEDARDDNDASAKGDERDEERDEEG